MAMTHGTNTEDQPRGALLDDTDFLRTLVERTLQELLDAEMTAHIGAEPYERTESRPGHRGVVWDQLLQESGQQPGGNTRCRVDRLAHAPAGRCELFLPRGGCPV